MSSSRWSGRRQHIDGMNQRCARDLNARDRNVKIHVVMFAVIQIILVVHVNYLTVQSTGFCASGSRGREAEGVTAPGPRRSKSLRK